MEWEVYLLVLFTSCGIFLGVFCFFVRIFVLVDVGRGVKFGYVRFVFKFLSVM